MLDELRFTVKMRDVSSIEIKGNILPILEVNKKGHLAKSDLSSRLVVPTSLSSNYFMEDLKQLLRIDLL